MPIDLLYTIEIIEVLENFIERKGLPKICGTSWTVHIKLKSKHDNLRANTRIEQSKRDI